MTGLASQGQARKGIDFYTRWSFSFTEVGLGRTHAWIVVLCNILVK